MREALLTVLLRCLQQTVFLIALALMYICMISFSFSSKAKKLDYEEEKVLDLKKSIQSVYGIIATDTSREAALTRIITIINKYNLRLTEKTKAALANEILEMSLRYDNLDVDLICATITHESARTWRPNITSPAGAMGLMQLMPPTGRYLSLEAGIEWTSAKKVLYDPIYNVRLGCRYLSALIESYTLDGGLAAYNGGASRAAKWLKSGRDDEVLFEETRGYVPAVLRLYDAFRE